MARLCRRHGPRRFAEAGPAPPTRRDGVGVIDVVQSTPVLRAVDVVNGWWVAAASSRQRPPRSGPPSPYLRWTGSARCGGAAGRAAPPPAGRLHAAGRSHATGPDRIRPGWRPSASSLRTSSASTAPRLRSPLRGARRHATAAAPHADRPRRHRAAGEPRRASGPADGQGLLRVAVRQVGAVGPQRRPRPADRPHAAAPAADDDLGQRRRGQPRRADGR